MRAGPCFLIRQALGERGEVFHSLLKRVKDRGYERMSAFERASQPGFGHHGIAFFRGFAAFFTAARFTGGFLTRGAPMLASSRLAIYFFSAGVADFEKVAGRLASSVCTSCIHF